MKTRMHSSLSRLAGLGLLLGACTTAAPNAQPTPDPAPAIEAALDDAFGSFLEGMVAYDALRLEPLAAMLAEEPPPFLLDVRQPEEVLKTGHIQGAVLIPVRDLMKHLDLLPSFDTPIVVYCGSGWRCTIALPALGALGWSDVSVLKQDSYSGWVAAGYPTVPGLPPVAEALKAASPDPAMVALLDQTLSNIPEGWGAVTVEQFASELAENPNLVVLDVRTAAEQAEKGVIESENLVRIPLEEFIRRRAEWPANKDAAIVIHAGTDHRSTIAMPILWSYGYTDVRSLRGGLRAWTDAGYPVVEAAAQ
jgi:rhodanese-related sulfurtransferase